MAGNSDPLFVRNGKNGSVLVTAANTSSQGGGTIGTDIFLAFTADATNGSLVRQIDFIPTATAPTTTTATVGRVFISSVSSGATTSANTRLVGEVTLPAAAADNASAAVLPVSWIPPAGALVLAASETVLITNHAAPAASTAWRINVYGGDF